MKLARAFSAHGRIGWMLLVVCLLVPGRWAQGSESFHLLREAMDKWSNERHAWAFTQRVHENDGAGKSRMRVERYDPSLGKAERWALVAIDGRPPTEKEIAAFWKRKGAKPNRRTKAPSEYVDFDRVAVRAENQDSIQYTVPLREDISRLIPLENLSVTITVDRSRRFIRHLEISLEDPMRIALGLARVTDMNFDLRFDEVDRGNADSPDGVQPLGVAEASVSRFGVQTQFSWSDFVRVGTPDDPPARSPVE